MGPFCIKAVYTVLKRLHSFGFGEIFPVQSKPSEPVSAAHLDAPAQSAFHHHCSEPAACLGLQCGLCVRRPNLFISSGPSALPRRAPAACGWAGGFLPPWHAGRVVCVCVHVCSLGLGRGPLPGWHQMPPSLPPFPLLFTLAWFAEC